MNTASDVVVELPSRSVLLVDDQPLIRSGLRMVLAKAAGFQVIGEASHGVEAIDFINDRRPDLVIMDIQMPVLDGVETMRRIRNLDDPPKVLMLTTFERDDYLVEALRAGASGFLLKTSPPERLIDALSVIAGGESLVDPAMTSRLIQFLGPMSRESSPPDVVLTEREREVLLLLAKGQSNGEISAALFIGEATVKTHVSSLLVKLGVRDRLQAVVYAYEHGIASPSA